MKLYVWDEMTSSNKGGLMMAVADSAKEAEESIRLECPYIPDVDFKQNPYEFTLDKGFSFIKLGSRECFD